MNPFATPSSGQSSDWLMFLVVLLAVGLGVCLVAVWIVFRSQDPKKRRKRHRRHRRQNPTLAETGGLPPPRAPNQPPPGP